MHVVDIVNEAVQANVKSVDRGVDSGYPKQRYVGMTVPRQMHQELYHLKHGTLHCRNPWHDLLLTTVECMWNKKLD